MRYVVEVSGREWIYIVRSQWVGRGSWFPYVTAQEPQEEEVWRLDEPSHSTRVYRSTALIVDEHLRK